MASTAHGTLTANTVTSVSITPGSGGVVVVNRDQAGAIWVRIDGQDPALFGNNSYVVLGARDFPMSRAQRQRGDVVVKLLSDTARTYSVEAIG